MYLKIARMGLARVREEEEELWVRKMAHVGDEGQAMRS